MTRKVKHGIFYKCPECGGRRVQHYTTYTGKDFTNFTNNRVGFMMTRNLDIIRPHPRSSGTMIIKVHEKGTECLKCGYKEVEKP